MAVTWAPAVPAGADAGTLAVVRDRAAGADPLTGGTDAASQVISQPDSAVEPSIAVNPNNPTNTVVAFMEGVHQNAVGAQNLGYATTVDGGKTWASSMLKIGTAAGGTWSFVADPSVAFGPENRVYISFIGEDTTPCTPFGCANPTGGDATQLATKGVGLIRSDDGGLHWSAVQNIDDVLQGHDTDWIVVDNGPAPGQPMASHHPGRVYAVWTFASPAPGEPVASYSDDVGATGTWQKVPSPVGMTAEGATLGFDDKAIVLNDGDLGIFFDTGHGGDAGPAEFFGVNPPPPPARADTAIGEKYLFAHAAAPVGGAPLIFDPPVSVGDALNNDEPSAAPATADGAWDPVAVVVDPTSGVISAAWTDGRCRSDARNDIVVSQSMDNGKTWSPQPIRVNHDDPSSGTNHFRRMVAVTPTGALRVAYRQRQQGPDPSTWSWNIDTLIQQASGPRTFAEPVRVNNVRTDIRYAATQSTPPQYFLGDYEQMATSGASTMVARVEALGPSDASATWPPSATHERIWVAVVK